MGFQTPLTGWHAAHGGRLVDFAGWDMPVLYGSILEEHMATRAAVGLFDVSHMGRLRVDGPDRVPFLDHILTNRVDNLRPDQVRYSLVLNRDAGIMDDVLVYRLADAHMLVVNASNREKIVAWLAEHVGSRKVTVTDLTFEWGMIACQGPRAAELVQWVAGERLDGVKNYHALEARMAGGPAILSRTGYTGEDGFEIIAPTDRIPTIWQQLIEQRDLYGVRAVGLGARDTLRLEAGMPLYGHELTELRDPIQAGLAWAVKADQKDFIGKDALARLDPQRPRRVGLKLRDKRIAREGFVIRDEHQDVGVVTSGAFTPTLQASVAMGYVPPKHAGSGTELDVVIRGADVPAVVEALPFYRRSAG